jgi:protein-glutamine gamma-glutamyltransferase
MTSMASKPHQATHRRGRPWPAWDSMRHLTPRPMSRDKADTLLLLLACVLVLAPHAGHLPGWSTLLCALLLLWRGWVTVRGDRLPSHWFLLPLAALAMLGIFAHYKTLLGRDAGVAMLVLLLAFKLLEMRARRDLFVVLFLSFFLLLTSFFYSQSIASALWMILSVMVLLAAQITFQFTASVPPLAQRLRLAATLGAMAAPLALVLFLLFPRISGPLWGLPGDAQAGRSGLSERMAPGAISNLALSDEIAFRARFDGTAPPPSQRYWRGPVLGQYDGRNWSELRPAPPANLPLMFRSAGTRYRYQITLEPHGQRWLLALEMPLGAPQLAGNPAHVGVNRELLAAHPVHQRLRYDVVSAVDAALEPTESPLLLQAWLQLPPQRNPRTRDFAQRLRAQAGSDAQAVQTVLKYFRTEEFHYTLNPPLLGDDGVDEFLFVTRTGFCEHYASAFVVLMRSMAIPARVVTGYQGGAVNPVDGFMTVRQSDAHAWAEVWLDGHGWTRVDPTAAVAPNRIELNLASVLPRPLLGGLIDGMLGLQDGAGTWRAHWQQWRANWDAVANGWNQWVLNYSTETQKNLLQTLGFSAPDWRSLTLLMGLGSAASLLLLIAPSWRRRSRLDAVDALYSALSQRMARRGMAREKHEGPQAYGRRLTAPQSPLADEAKSAVARFLNLYELHRYGCADAVANGASGKRARALQRSAILSQLKTLLTQCR